MYKERVEKFSDLLLVREVQRAVKGYPKSVSTTCIAESDLCDSPDAFQVHGSNLHHVSCLLALQDAITASASHAGNIQQLRAIDHVVVFSSRDAYAICFDLEAQAALVLPQRRGHSGLHARRCDLARGVECVLRLILLP